MPTFEDVCTIDDAVLQQFLTVNKQPQTSISEQIKCPLCGSTSKVRLFPNDDAIFKIGAKDINQVILLFLCNQCYNIFGRVGQL